MNKFSIIIPAYNCSDTIEKCIKSVLNQNYDNYEILIVDDGSTDNTRLIIEKFKEYSKIKIFYQKNSGVSSARNRALKNISGNWVIFLDSDDWIENNSLNEIDKIINKYNPDFLISPVIYDTIKAEKNETYVIKNKKTVIDGIISVEYIEKKYKNKYKNFRCIGGKIFKSSLIKENEIVFPDDLKKFEDGIFNLTVAKYSEKIVYTNYQFYNYYYNNPKSRMNTFYNNETSEYLNIFSKVKEYLKSIEYETISINYLAFYSYITSVDTLMHLDMSKKEKKKEINYLFTCYSDYFSKIKLRYLGFIKKIEYIVSKLHSVNLIYIIYKFKIKILKK